MAASSMVVKKLCQARPLAVGALFELLDTPGRRGKRAPRIPRFRPACALLGADERVEQLELVARTRKPPLSELAGEREQPVRGGDEVVAGDAPAPGVSAGATVAIHAARDDEPGLVVRPQLAQRLHAVLVEEALGDVELRLDVRLGACRADGCSVALRAEQQPDRLGDDRLPRAGLAGQGDEPRVKLEVGLADQDEVLDPQSP